MDHTEQYKHFVELIKDFDTSMLISQGLNGALIARPMAVAGFDTINSNVYFFSGNDTEKVQEILHNAHVVLAFMTGWKMISLSGIASLVERQSPLFTQFWKDSYKVWFPRGLEDPQLALIKVTPALGEYWDNSGLESVKYFFQSAKSLITGTPPELSDKQHGVVRFE